MTLVVPRQVARQIIKPIARQLIPSLGKKSLDIRAKVGTSTSPTSTGTKAVTGVGFQPKVVLPFNNWDTTYRTTTEASLFLGAATASASASIAVWSETAKTTSVTGRRHVGNKPVTQVFASTVSLEAALSSLDADGFTLNWNPVLGSAFPLNHIALGGADLEVSLVQCQMHGTNAAQSFAHGLSGAPTGVLFFMVGITSASAATQTFLRTSIGAWAGANQFGAAIHSANGVTTTETRRILSTSACVLDAGTSVFRSLAVSSVDATNVNVTYTGNTARSQFWMLCIRGAKCQVGTFQFTDVNPKTITTTGITPKLFLPVMIEKGVASVGVVQNDLGMTIGASDGTNNVSCGITDQTGVTTTNARRYQSSNSIVQYGYDGNKYFEATAAFSGESVVITPTTRLYDFGQSGYLILGS